MRAGFDYFIGLSWVGRVTSTENAVRNTRHFDANIAYIHSLLKFNKTDRWTACVQFFVKFTLHVLYDTSTSYTANWINWTWHSIHRFSINLHYDRRSLTYNAIHIFPSWNRKVFVLFYSASRQVIAAYHKLLARLLMAENTYRAENLRIKDCCKHDK